jgi:hypothetical protein
MEEGARAHHSYGSYAPSSYGSYEPRRANPSTAPQVEGEGKEKEKKKEAADAKKIFSLVYDEVEDGPVTRIGIDGADAWCMRAPAELPPCSISPALNSVTLSW